MCKCETDYVADTLRTYLDAGELNHNGLLLLGAVKNTGGRGGEEGERGGKGGRGWKRESKVQRGDVDGKVKGGGRGGQTKRGEEVRSQVGQIQQELGSRGEEGRNKWDVS